VALVRAEPVARNVGVLFTEIGTGGGDELVDRGVAFIVVADLFDRARIEKPLREVFTLGHVENRVAAHDRTVADLVLVVLVLPHHRLHKENRDAVLAPSSRCRRPLWPACRFASAIAGCVIPLSRSNTI
jgi:hypothetical protein